MEVPVRAGEDYIEVNTPEEKEFTDELVIYADDVLLAKKLLNAFIALSEACK